MGGWMSEIKLKEKIQIMSPEDIERCLTRISHEIVEHNKGVENCVVVGMRTRGYHLACRIGRKISEIENKKVPVGALDVSFYRDDFRSKVKQPGVKATDILFSIDEQNVILVDDVFYTGRTVRAALDELVDLGRPKTIQFAVLVDRGHREMPIKADYIGKNIPTSQYQEVAVRVTEEDKVDGVWMMEVEA